MPDPRTPLTPARRTPALQLQRELDINYNSALFLLNRTRFGMKDWPGEGSGAKVGAGGGTLEADETYVGGKPRYKGTSKRGRGTKKTPVFAMVERGGRLRMQVVERITAQNFGRIVDENLNVTARLITDDLGVYGPIGRNHLGGHESVKHGQGEYVHKSDPVVHSNTVESAFSLLKRGVYGTYHSISRHHLPRYLGEFEFRWNTRFADDGERTLLAVKRAEGKRLVYRAAGT